VISQRRAWPARRTHGIAGSVLFLLGVVATVAVLAVLTAVGLAAMLVVGVAIGVSRVLATLSPAYRRRRREHAVTMAQAFRTVVRFAPTGDRPIEATAVELPDERNKP
jgi:Flp pilus assembly protein TadB